MINRKTPHVTTAPSIGKLVNTAVILAYTAIDINRMARNYIK
jgi:hypothetical protein